MEPLNVKLDEMILLYEKGLIGQIEFRDWLAHHSPSFAEVRNPTVDEMIRGQAELSINNMREYRRQLDTGVVDREGGE